MKDAITKSAKKNRESKIEKSQITEPVLWTVVAKKKNNMQSPERFGD